MSDLSLNRDKIGALKIDARQRISEESHKSFQNYLL